MKSSFRSYHLIFVLITTMLTHFEGVQYRLSDNWFSFIDLQKYKSIPIRYLEIGAFYGANLISVDKTYGSHPESKLYCIDPWEDYADYPEYKNKLASTINSSKTFKNQDYKIK